jgi:hypothetical protein
MTVHVGTNPTPGREWRRQRTLRIRDLLLPHVVGLYKLNAVYP